jgi:hypothetical protein
MTMKPIAKSKTPALIIAPTDECKPGNFKPSRREFLATLGTLGAASFFNACGGSPSADNPPPVQLPSQPIPAAPLTAATVSVTSTQTATIPASFAGLSYEKSKLSQPLFTGSNTDLIGLFKLLGNGVLRIGGNSVDETNWNGSGAGQTSGQVAPSDVNSLAAFLSAVEWPVLYGVNLAQSTPAAAAAEVEYVAKALGSNLLGIEIGNEPDLYAGHYFPADWTFSDYYTLWQSFASAILTQAPGVPLTGPVTADNSTWFTSFAQDEGKNVALLSMHYYRANGQDASSNIALLVSYPDTNLQKDLVPLKAAAAAAGVPYRMAETNSFYNGGAPNVSDSYASALWVLDHMFTIAQGGSVGLNLHGGGDSTGYTPIADNNGVVVEARSEYYGVLLFTLAGQGPLLTTTIVAGGLNVSAYTIQNSPSRLSMIVVNKDSTQNLQFTTSCPAAVQSATLQLLMGPSLAASTGVTIQGSAVNPDGSFAPQSPYGLTVSADTLSGYVPAASAALVVITLG